MKAQVIEDVDPLTPNESFTTGARDMTLVASDFSAAYVYYHAAVDSDQSGELMLLESTDLITWEELGPLAQYVGASGVMEISSLVTLRYVSAEFTNGSVPQTRFTMTTGVDQS